MANSLQQTIQRLLRRIPGYASYATYATEAARRRAAKATCIRLAHALRAERQALVQLGQQLVARGRLEYTERLDASTQALDHLASRLETLAHTDAGRINAPDPTRDPHPDDNLASRLPLLREHIGYVASQVEAGAERPDMAEALDALQGFIANLHSWLDRQQAPHSGSR